MNSVKISGLVLMGAFTVGITSGSIVSAAASTEVVSDAKDESKDGELGDKKDLLDDDNISNAETEAGDDNPQNTDGILSTEDGEQSGEAVAEVSGENGKGVEKGESGNKGGFDIKTASLIGGTGAAGTVLGAVTNGVIHGGKEKTDSGKQEEKKTEQDNTDTNQTPGKSDSEEQKTSDSFFVPFVATAIAAVICVVIIVVLAFVIRNKNLKIQEACDLKEMVDKGKNSEFPLINQF